MAEDKYHYDYVKEVERWDYMGYGVSVIHDKKSTFFHWIAYPLHDHLSELKDDSPWHTAKAAGDEAMRKIEGVYGNDVNELQEEFPF